MVPASTHDYVVADYSTRRKKKDLWKLISTPECWKWVERV